MTDVKPIPEGYNTVSSYLTVPNAKEALKFYEKALGAETLMVMDGPNGSTMHAEMKIGNSRVMVSDEHPEYGVVSAKTLGGSPVSMFIYSEDVDALFKRATDAGCEVVQPLNNAFWGDRFGKVKDPFGLQWAMATHIEDVSPEEMMKRQKAFAEAMAKGEMPE